MNFFGVKKDDFLRMWKKRFWVSFLCCVAAVRKLQQEFAAVFLHGWMLGSHVFLS